MTAFKAEFHSLSDPGKVRSNNEDSVLADNVLGLAIVADGMGGHSSGEVASKIAVSVTREKFESMRVTGLKPNPYDDKYLPDTNQLGFSVQLANSVVYEAGNAKPENKGMGTTLSAALIVKDRLCAAHIGDSRVYLYRNGVLQQVTEDHSLVMDHVRKGLLTREQAEKSPFQNILTRALGTQKNPPVDLYEVVLAEGDRILLCTDGLFKPLSETDFTGILKAEPDDAKACAAMVKAANNNGGPDNVTVVLGTARTKSWKESLKDMLK